MRNKVAAVGIIIGGLIVVAGIISGFVTHTQAGYGCGSGFAPAAIGGFSLSAAYVTALCNQATSAAAGAAWALIIVGALMAVGSVSLFKRTQSPDPHPQTPASAGSTQPQAESRP